MQSIQYRYTILMSYLRKKIGPNTPFFLLTLQPPWALASNFVQIYDHFTDDRTPWASDQLVARPLPKLRTTQTQNKHIHVLNIHAGIRNHHPGFRASEDNSCLRLLGYHDQQHTFLVALNYPCFLQISSTCFKGIRSEILQSCCLSWLEF
jgi:hypothetical protein